MLQNTNILRLWCALNVTLWYLKTRIRHFDSAYQLIHRMPTRCNRGFYCRSYCLLHKTLQNYFLHFYSTKYHRQQPLYNTLELLMMGIVVPETYEQAIRSAIKTSVASRWHFISTHGVSSITTTDAHTSAASSQLN